MFVSNISEIQKILPFVTSGDISIINPAIEKAEDDYLTKILDNTTLAELKTKYNANFPSVPIWEKLHLKCNAITIPFALLEVLPHIATKMSSGSITGSGSEDKVPLKMWEYKNIERSLWTKGHKAIDDLYIYLEENKATFTDWAGSALYSQFKKYFINTADQFDSFVRIGKSRAIYLKMIPNMETIEQMVILPTLGVTFFNELKGKIVTNNLDANEKTIVDYCRRIIALKTCATSANELSFNLDGAGISSTPRLYNDTYEQDTTPRETIERYVVQCDNTAEKFLSLMVSNLKTLASPSVFLNYYNFINAKNETTDYNDSARGLFRF
jgi:hypothetical protein